MPGFNGRRAVRIRHRRPGDNYQSHEDPEQKNNDSNERPSQRLRLVVWSFRQLDGPLLLLLDKMLLVVDIFRGLKVVPRLRVEGRLISGRRLMHFDSTAVTDGVDPLLRLPVLIYSE